MGFPPPILERSISVDFASDLMLIFLPLKPADFVGFWPAGNLYLLFGASIFADFLGAVNSSPLQPQWATLCGTLLYGGQTNPLASQLSSIFVSGFASSRSQLIWVNGIPKIWGAAISAIFPPLGSAFTSNF